MDTVTAAWVDWLGRMDWDYAVDLTFRVPTSVARGRRKVRRWLRALGSKAYGAAIFARGRIGGRWHAHVLLGGVGRKPGTEAAIRSQAWRYCGRTTVEPYSPRKGPRGGMIQYRVADQDHDLGELTLMGAPRPYHPRRRR